MMPPGNRSVSELSEETGISAVTLYAWRKHARAAGAVVPGDGKSPEGWSSPEKFRVVLESAGLNETELAEYCRRKGLYVEQIRESLEAINGLFQATKRRARGFTRMSTIRTVIFLIAGKLNFSTVNPHVAQPT